MAQSSVGGDCRARRHLRSSDVPAKSLAWRGARRRRAHAPRPAVRLRQRTRRKQERSHRGVQRLSTRSPRRRTAAALLGGTKKESGKKVKVNTKDHNDFQENINRYLQGTPDDVFMWFAGYRMQYFAEKGLLHEISDVWSGFTGFSMPTVHLILQYVC